MDTETLGVMGGNSSWGRTNPNSSTGFSGLRLDSISPGEDGGGDGPKFDGHLW